MIDFTVAMSAWMGCVGTVAKDFSDIRGDAVAGRRSLALILGVGRAGSVLAGTALAVSIGFTVATMLWSPGLVAAALVMLSGALTVAFLALRLETTSSGNLRLPYRAFMVTQYATLLVVMCSL